VKAIRYHRYGDGEALEFGEVDIPEPTEDRVLVRIRAASVNSWDWSRLRGRPLWGRFDTGWRRPKNPRFGADLAGTVVAVGPDVTDFVVGDEVLGDLSWFGWGAFAEYAAVRQRGLAPKSSQLTFEEAAAVPQAGLLALQGIRKADLKEGERVLINGAGGGTGTFAIQMAKSIGAEVIGVDRAMKADLIHSLGADEFIDFEQQDYTKSGDRYDLILDLEARRSVFAYRRCLNPGGRFVVVGGTLRSLLQVVTLGRLIASEGRSLRVLMHKPNREDMEEMNRLIEAGTVKPVVEMVYPLEDAAAAVRHLGEGRTLGKVVISI